MTVIQRLQIDEKDQVKQNSAINQLAEFLDRSGAGPRERLSVARTYYVLATGSDANDGLSNSAGGAFITIQKALDVCAGLIDFGSQQVTISIGAGTFTQALTLKPWIGSGSLVINGAGVASTTINGNGSNIITASTGALPGPVTLSNFKLTTTGNQGIICQQPAAIVLNALEFGSVGGNHVAAFAGGVFITLGGNYTISGGAGTHWSARAGGLIQPLSRTITLSGSPVFSVGFAEVQFGEIATVGMTFSGATGASSPRYSAIGNGLINTFGGGLNYFPGTVAGTSASGGQYL